ARCMSPFQYDPATNYTSNYLIPEDEWQGITCAVCHNPHTNELTLYNGTGWEEPLSDPSDLCTACHSGSHHETGWGESAHSNTFGDHQNNTYCAGCHSPYNYEEMYNETTETSYGNKKGVLEEDWFSIGCIVCHDQHTLEVALWNGTGREDPIDNPSDLCVSCHRKHGETGWDESAHSNTFGDHQNNTYCASCHSPYNYEEMYNETTETSYGNKKGVLEEDWLSIGCIVCHDQHTLEVA
ncbi:unnamed protein product, partial [marine sediment metagenome]